MIIYIYECQPKYKINMVKVENNINIATNAALHAA